jgi:general secretion pathway protein G
VFTHLDPAPESVVYVNLPRIQAMLRESQMVQGALASNAEAKPVADFFLDPELASSGFGVTTTEVGGGVRQTSFGPSWMSSGAATAGVVAAIAVPNMLNAINRGRQKRTMADMRTVATAIEAYNVDNNVYPGPTDGWVGVDTLNQDLVPDYLSSLPVNDGWDHPFLFWSDGSSYRLVSPGKDGETSRDWLGEVESEETTDFSADIVYGDGMFMVWPSSGG